MSKIYSFRLSEENTREAKAREVINTWSKRGYSLRHLLTEALLSINKLENEKKSISTMLDDLEKILSILEPTILTRDRSISGKIELSSDFLQSIKKTVKSGVNIK